MIVKVRLCAKGNLAVGKNGFKIIFVAKADGLCPLNTYAALTIEVIDESKSLF